MPTWLPLGSRQTDPEGGENGYLPVPGQPEQDSADHGESAINADERQTTPSPSPPSPRWLRTVKRVEWIWPCMPWVIAVACGKTDRRLPRKTSTSYLTGVRGIACLIVYKRHFTEVFFPRIAYAYGVGESSFIQLPVLRAVNAGLGMVCIFFILSGFVLAYSPLRKVHNPSRTSASELVTGLCSSILRRGIRLFGPLMPVAMMTCIATWVYPAFLPGGWAANDPTFVDHLRLYVKITLPLFNPFSWDIYQPESFNHAWTLPTEYRGSMIIFLMCIATARLTTRARKLVIVSTMLWALYLTRTFMFCFLYGMFLAELRYSPLSEDFPILARIKDKFCSIVGPKTSLILGYLLAACVVLASLLVLGWPDLGADRVEPYRSLIYLLPRTYSTLVLVLYFWGSIGAVGIMTVAENLAPVQWLFSTTPLLYLGEISFSFYLLHWIWFAWPGTAMIMYLIQQRDWSLVWAFYVTFYATMVCLLLSADCYWRAVDEKCVNFGKTLVKWLGVHDDTYVDVAIGVAETESGEEKNDGDIPLVNPESDEAPRLA